MTFIGFTFCKGGTGKTSSCLAIQQAMRARGQSVLCIDMDPQCSLTDMMGGNPSKTSVCDVILGRCHASDAIIHSDMGDLIPASPMLSVLDKQTEAMQDRDKLLRDALRQIEGCYSWILMDGPPALNICQTMVLMASQLVIIPLIPDRASSTQIIPFLYTIGRIQDTGNPDIDAIAIITHWNPRINVNSAYDQQIRASLDEYGIPVIGYVRETSGIREAQAIGADLYQSKDYKRGHAAEDYGSIADELIKHIKRRDHG